MKLMKQFVKLCLFIFFGTRDIGDGGIPMNTLREDDGEGKSEEGESEHV